MKVIGYVRVSTYNQNTDRQLDNVSLDKVFTDKVSGGTRERPALVDMLDYIREGDKVMVHSIDRLARSLVDLHSIVSDIVNKGATVHFNSEGMSFDNSAKSPHQMLHLSVLGAFAEFERGISKERQKEGIVKAQALGKYQNVGRKGLDEKVVNEIKELVSSGMSKAAVARKLGISRAIVYKYM